MKNVLFIVFLFLFCHQMDAESSSFGSTKNDSLEKSGKNSVVTPLQSGEFLLLPQSAVLSGGVQLDIQNKHIKYLSREDRQASWNIDVPGDGDYIVHLAYSIERDEGGVFVIISPERLWLWHGKPTGDWNKFESQRLGVISLKKGRQELGVRSLVEGKDIHLASIRLIPARGETMREGDPLGGPTEQPKTLLPERPGSIILTPFQVVLGSYTNLDWNLNYSIGHMDRLGRRVSWPLELEAGGYYLVETEFSSAIEGSGENQPYEIGVGENVLIWRTACTGGWNQFRIAKLGIIGLEKGLHEFSIVSKGIGGANFGNVRLTLIGEDLKKLPQEVVRVVQAYQRKRQELADGYKKEYLDFLEKRMARCEKNGETGTAKNIKADWEKASRLDPMELFDSFAGANMNQGGGSK